MRYLIVPDVDTEDHHEGIDFEFNPPVINKGFFLHASNPADASKCAMKSLSKTGIQSFVVVPYEPKMYIHFPQAVAVLKEVTVDGETLPKVVP